MEMAALAENAPVEPKKEKKSFIEVVGLRWIVLGIVLFGIIAFAIYTALTQPVLPTEQAMYAFVTSNFNATISKNFSLPTEAIAIINTSTVLTNNKTVVQLPDNNRTYIWFFSADYCPECAVESYILWNYTTQSPFPALDTDFYGAGFNIPGIPNSYINSNATTGMRFVGEQIPLSTAQVDSESSNASVAFTLNWLKSNLNLQQKVIFQETGYIPGLLVTKGVGNKTIVCSAYSGISFIKYNASTSSQFLGIDTKGLPLNSVVPTSGSINYNYNLLNACYNAVSKWNGLTLT